MHKYFVTFASKPGIRQRGGPLRNYELEAQAGIESAARYGFNTCLWTEDDIRATDFYKYHPDFMGGYLFKPFIIWRTLQDIGYGDFILWTDSNHVLIADPQPLLDIASRYGIFCHDHWTNSGPKIYPNAEWTKRDTFLIMDCDEERYWQSPQIQVNVLAFCQSGFTLEFCSEWLTYACDKRIMTLDPTNTLGLPNFPNFQENRSEQSIFSILQVKYGIPAQPDPFHIVKELEV